MQDYKEPKEVPSIWKARGINFEVIWIYIKKKDNFIRYYG